MTLAEALQQATQQLQPYSSTPRLDAELLLIAACQGRRTNLYAHPECELSAAQQYDFTQWLTRRIHGEPIAYLLGKQEFWSLNFKVTPDTLIPRPETEHLVEWTLAHFSPVDCIRVADLGTGCGTMAIALAHERPHWQIDATEQSTAALAVAQENAKHLHTTVHYYQGDWCLPLPRRDYHLLISNPPYLAYHDPHLLDLRFEPEHALVAGNTGLEAIAQIAVQAPHYLLPNGYLLLEHGSEQANAVCTLLAQAGFVEIQSHSDLAGLARYVSARLKG